MPSSTIPTDQPLDSTTTQPQTTQPTTTETPTTTPSTPRSTVATPANAGNDVASNNAAGTEEASNDIGSNGGTGTDQANGSSDPTTTKATRNPDKVGGTGTSDETSNASTSIGENAPDELALTDDQSMRIDLRAKVGDMAANRDGQVDASGLKPGTVLIVEVHSTPIEVARLTVARDGTASGSFKLPESLEDGNHRIITHGVLPNGSQIGRDYAFLVDKERIAEVAAPVGGLYPVRAFGNAPDQLAFYAPVNDVNHVLHTQGQFFAMVTAAGAAAVAVRGSRGSRSRSTVKAAGTRTSLREDVGSGSNATKDSGSDNSREYSEVFAADAVFEVLDPDDRTLARGDRSRTWRWKGTSSVDRWSRDLPDPINRFSPLVARVITDGQWLRAAIGPLALLLPFVGAVLGVAAGFKAGGTYLPPAIAWIVVLLVLGIFDAAAGAVAGLSYLIVTVATGGMPTADNMRATAGLLTLWFAPALAAAMIRPVRRVLDGSRASKIERVADCIIGPMCGAWTAQNAIWAQSGLSGRQLPIGNYLGRLTLLAGGCLLVRYLLETAVLQWYPQRSAMTDAGEPDATSRIQQIISVSLRGLMFIGIATAFYPLSWQLVFGGVALSFSILVYLEWIGDRMPNLGFLHRFVPGELTYLAVLLVACDFITRRLPNWESDPQRQMLMGIVYYGIPGIALGLVVLFGREGKRPEWKQWHYALGIPMIAVLSKVMFFA